MAGKNGMRRRQIAVQTPTGQALIAGFELGPDTGKLDVLFLHANGFNALTYRHVMAELDPAIRLLAVDLRGHGLTKLPVPEDHPGWQLYADDLCALIAALGTPPRLLAGHSMGGATALLAAANLPAIERLMLFDPVIPPQAMRAETQGKPLWDLPMVQAALRRKASFTSRADAFEAYEGRGAFRTWQDAMLHDYIQDGLVPAPGGHLTLACTPAWEAANFATFGVADALAGLIASPQPMTIFTAAHGSTCHLDHAALPAAARRRVHREILPGTSHFLPMERPGIVAKAIGEALRGVK
jgi:pimeloyl-ACP methyl ester carboxylesterase